MNLLLAIASILLFPVAAAGADGPLRCPGNGIRAPGWNAEECDLACNAAAAAIAFFEAAGLADRAHDLTIRPLPPGEEEDACVVGRYDVLRNEILILDYTGPSSNRGSIRPPSTYR